MRKDIGFAAQLTSASQGRYPAIEGLKAIVDALGSETYDNWRYIGAAPPPRT